MKIIKYNLCTRVNCGTQDEPKFEEVLFAVKMPWNEGNEAIAKAEAHNGEYTVVEDGQAEPAPTDAQRITQLEATINVLLGVNE